MVDDTTASDVRQRLQGRYRRLAEARRLRPITAIVARFTEIDGGTLGAMVSVQLFTTVIPLMIMGFAYMRGFADNASPGTMIIRELGLVTPSIRPRARCIRPFLRAAVELDLPRRRRLSGVGHPDGHHDRRHVRQGLAPRAVRPPRQTLAWRGVVRPVSDDDRPARPDRLRRRPSRRNAHGAASRCSLLPVWIFWSLTPALLVRDGGRGRNYLMLAGLAGVVIDGIMLPLGCTLRLPAAARRLGGVRPIGVAMALLTWCGAVGVRAGSSPRASARCCGSATPRPRRSSSRSSMRRPRRRAEASERKP